MEPEFSATLNTSSLNGENGFRMTIGLTGHRGAGYAGDINGDGYDDFWGTAGGATHVFFNPGVPFSAISGTRRYYEEDLLISGIDPDEWTQNLTDQGIWWQEFYVSYHTTSGGEQLYAVSTLNGDNGFVVDGGSVIPVGDLNEDGFDDLYVPGSGIIYGAAGGLQRTIDPETLEMPEDWTYSPPGNDVNGDGFDDLVTPTSVVFGTAEGIPDVPDTSALDGTNGFTIDLDARAALVVGDMDGDGFNDILLSNVDANSEAGEAYVIFGAADGFPSVVDPTYLDGTRGFTLSSGYTKGYEYFGSIGAVGDINDDGLADIIIGAAGEGDGTYSDETGAAYVFFGSSEPYPAHFSGASLNGENGFKVYNGDWDYIGYPVGWIGDINNDGVDDAFIGASDAGASYYDCDGCVVYGATYVVFGIDTTPTAPPDLGIMQITVAADAGSDQPLFGLMATETDGDNVSYRLRNGDSDAFDIDGTGVVSASPPLDFDAPTDRGANNGYTFEAVAFDRPMNDPDYSEDSVRVTVLVVDDPEPAVTVALTDVATNAAPVAAVSSIEIDVYEGAVDPLLHLFASDPDGDTFKWRLRNGDRDAFEIDRDTGELAFRELPDFDAPVDRGGDNSYQFQAVVFDRAQSHSEYQEDVITVTVHVHEADALFV